MVEAAIVFGVFLILNLIVLVLLWRAPRGRQIPGVGFMRDEGVERRLKDYVERETIAQADMERGR